MKISRKMKEKSPENKILAKGNNSYKKRSNATKVKLDLYCQDKFIYNVPNFKSKSHKTAVKSWEICIFGKGYNSSKSRSTVTKVKLDLYHVKTKSYTKFQVNISKDD